MSDNSPVPFKNVDEPSPMKVDVQTPVSIPEEETKEVSKQNEETDTVEEEDTS